MTGLERTLVKSQPELWQLVDQPERMHGWISSLLGRAAEPEVTEREPETLLAWRAEAGEEAASIEIALSKKGWGTNVEIFAERDGAAADQLDDWLEAVLDELASTEKRPFRGIV
jgi:hypothetical protein